MENKSKDAYLVAFQLISHAGNARSMAIEAISAAKDGDCIKADRLMNSAENELVESHKIQTGLLTKEANGNKNEINVILIHSMDHLSMAIDTIDYAKNTIILYRKLATLQSEIVYIKKGIK